MEVRNGALSIAKIAPVRIQDSGVLVGQLKRLTEMIGK